MHIIGAIKPSIITPIPMVFKRVVLVMVIAMTSMINVVYAQPSTIQPVSKKLFSAAVPVVVKVTPTKRQVIAPSYVNIRKTMSVTAPSTLPDFDADNDSYKTTKHNRGTDCNDKNAAIHPGATEIWYDGVDQNCDKANDYDQDGDGYVMDPDHHRPEGTPLDCDDTDASVHPYGGGTGNCPGGNSQNIPTTDSGNTCLTIGDSLFYAYPTSGAHGGRAYSVSFFKKGGAHAMENGWTELEYTGGKISVAIQDVGRTVWLSGLKVQTNLQIWNAEGVYLTPTSVNGHFVTYGCPAS